jgi:lipopolysaccharide/colanic/teichoic acid biosynthesis glycosyltransferase
MKRIFDFTTSLFGIAFLCPFFLLIGLFIKLNNNGDILYKQVRVGKNGNLFVLYKFRSMKSQLLNNEGIFEPGQISHITTIGKFLRRAKLDELPQLYNVLTGDMSLVGPRPEVKKWTEVYPEKWAIVHSVRPGITDNASIEFLNEEELLSQSQNPEETYRTIILPRKLDLYVAYVNNHTFQADIKIILRTIVKILSK